MDFFDAQDSARRRSWKLIALFAAAVIALLVLANLVVAVAVALSYGATGNGDFATLLTRTPREQWWWISSLVLLMVGGACLYKYLALGSGGRAIAEMLGGRRVVPDTSAAGERRLLNVVEEMALAAGVPVPVVYLMPEAGINAFAAGLGTDDAVIGITDGALESLSRDELQGVIAHEFSHIVNGDMHLNLRLIALLHGIVFIGLIGFMLIRRLRFMRRGSNAMPIVVMGAGLVVIGFAGTFFGNLIKAAVSRQREYLADAAAVQFTRNPRGIAGALKKIGASQHGAAVTAPAAEQASHMFFGQAVTPFMSGLMATHPPLEARIRAIEPGWDGRFPRAREATGPPESRPLAAEAAMAGASALSPHGSGTTPARAGNVRAEYGRLDGAAIDAARALLEDIDPALLEVAHDPFHACTLVYAMLLSAETETREAQLSRLAEDPHTGLAPAVRRLSARTDALDAPRRLALLSLAMPALKGLSLKQYHRLVEHVLALIRADRRISLFEWVLHRLLVKELKPEFETVRAPRQRYRSVAAVPEAANELLSALARNAPAGSDRRAAHAAGAARLALEQGHVEAEDPSFRRLSAAIETLRGLRAPAKARLLEACAAVALADDHLAAAQWALLQGVSAALDCPLPPHLPPKPQRRPGPASDREPMRDDL